MNHEETRDSEQLTISSSSDLALLERNYGLAALKEWLKEDVDSASHIFRNQVLHYVLLRTKHIQLTKAIVKDFPENWTRVKNEKSSTFGGIGIYFRMFRALLRRKPD